MFAGIIGFLKENGILFVIFFLVFIQYGTTSEIFIAVNKIKEILGSDPKIHIADMKIVADKVGLIDGKDNKKNNKWKIIGIISITINIVFILLIVLGILFGEKI